MGYRRNSCTRQGTGKYIYLGVTFFFFSYEKSASQRTNSFGYPLSEIGCCWLANISSWCQLSIFQSALRIRSCQKYYLELGPLRGKLHRTFDP